MQLGIDLGTLYTRMAARNDTEKPVILEPVPSILAYTPETGHFYSGQKALKLLDKGNLGVWPVIALLLSGNPELKLGHYDLQQALTGFFTFLHQRVKTVTVNPIDFVTLSVPNYLGLKARRHLYTCLQTVFSASSVYLLPEPAAALLGYQTVHPEVLLKGEILIIEFGSGTIDFSFLTVAQPDCRVVVEKQLHEGYDALLNTEVVRSLFSKDSYISWQNLSSYLDTVLEPQARSFGLLEKRNWNLDHLLILGGAALTRRSHQLLQDYFKGVSVHGGTEDPYKALGNCVFEKGTGEGIFTIHPFRFFIERRTDGGDQQLEVGGCGPENVGRKPDTGEQGPGGVTPETPRVSAELIPFDTDNLELNPFQRYHIFSLWPQSRYNLATDADRVEIRIHELPNTVDEETSNNFSGQYAVLEYRGPLQNTGEPIHIDLDMGSSQLVVNSTQPENVYEANLFSDWTDKQLDRAEWLSGYKYVDSELINTLQAHLKENQARGKSPYSNQLTTTYHKLLCLLQIHNPP